MNFEFLKDYFFYYTFKNNFFPLIISQHLLKHIFFSDLDQKVVTVDGKPVPAFLLANKVVSAAKYQSRHFRIYAICLKCKT